MISLQGTGIWIVQLMVSAGVAVLLPRRQWTWKVLAGMSVIADLAEMSVPRGTFLYFKVYWGLRVAELLWLAFGTCRMCHRLRPQAEGVWAPFIFCLLATVAIGPWRTNLQMQILQVMILLACAIPAWLYAYIFWEVRLFAYALATLLTLEIACALAWRWQGYHAAGWFIAWISGMGMLLYAEWEDQRNLKRWRQT